MAGTPNSALEVEMKFLEGKKTYIVALVLVLLGAYLAIWYEPVTGTAVIFVGLGMTTLGTRMNRHQREVLDVLTAIRKVVVEKQPLGIQDKARLAGDAMSIASEFGTIAPGEEKRD
jgi:hypothetical protein